MKAKKRTVSLFLALMMLAGVMGVPALADSEPVSMLQPAPGVVFGESGYDDSDDFNEDEIIEVIIELTAPGTLEADPENSLEYLNPRKSGDVASANSIAFNRLAQAEKVAAMQQKAVIGQVAAVAPELEVTAYMSAIMNGFVASVRVGDVAEIEALTGVKAVYPVEYYNAPETGIVEPNDKYGNEGIGAVSAWTNTGYTGKGEVIAIFDSGLDYNHELFGPMEEHEDMLTLEELQAIVDLRSLNCVSTDAKYATMNEGQFYRSNKVPFGYDYSSTDNDPMDDRQDEPGHGTHVTGIAAANRNEEGIVIGSAPDAQVFAMKVFSASTTSSSIYCPAIDDAIKLGATVCNLSLGSAAGNSSFPNSETRYDSAFYNAMMAGITINISAGNSYRWGERDAANYNENVVGRPTTSYMDFGMIGSPSSTGWVNSVASADNNQIHAYFFTIGGVEGEFLYNDTNNLALRFDKVLGGGVYELAYVGLAGPDDFEGINVSGKIAVAYRGTHSFVDKTKNAADRGAVGMIIVDNAPSGVINMVTDGNTIPSVSMPKADGDRVVAAIQAGNTTVTVSDYNKPIPSASAGYMSTFSSWGVTPDLRLKPEITAYGGNVYSTWVLSEGGYKLNGGTSMSAPHVTGGTALIQQRVREEFPQVTGYDRKLLVDNLMMSSAVPIVLPTGKYVSPRQAGAGMMELLGATTTNVIVTNNVEDDYRSKVELGDNLGDSITFPIVVKNYGSAEYAYDLEAIVMRDGYAESEMGYGYVLEDFNELLDASAAFSIAGEAVTSVTVPAGGSVVVDVAITLNAGEMDALTAEVFENGLFVDAYVRLIAKSDEYTNIGIPVMGYYGSWADVPVYDNPYDDNTTYGLYYYSSSINAGMRTNIGSVSVNAITGRNYMAGSSYADAELIAINPNGGSYGSLLRYYAIQHRNVASGGVNIYDLDGNRVRTGIQNTPSGTKSYYNSTNSYTPVRTVSANFNGKGDNGENLPDGKYSFVLTNNVRRATSRTENEEIQVRKELPFYVDSTAPSATSAWVTETDNGTYLNVQTSDEHYVMAAVLYAGDTVYDTVYFQTEGLEKNPVAVFDLTDYFVDPAGYGFKVEVVDMAYNFTQTDLDELLESDVSIEAFNFTPSTIAATLSYRLAFSIEGTGTGSLTISSDLFEGVYPVSLGYNNIAFEAAPSEPGDYNVYLYNNGMPVGAVATVKVLPYNTSIWSATAYAITHPEEEGNPGVTLGVKFNAKVSVDGAVTANGVTVTHSSIADDTVELDYYQPELTNIVLNKVKLTELFPSYYFTYKTTYNPIAA